MVFIMLLVGRYSLCLDFPCFPPLPPSLPGRTQAFIQLFVAWTVVPVGCCEALRAGLGKR